MTDPATSPAATAPLAGVRVLDFSRVLAGPFCTLQLADLGAEVIKLENPDGGDDTRQFKPPEAGGEAHYYLAVNRSKRSVALDIRKPEAQEIVHGLAAKCDVLIQNYRVGVMERVGFGWETMRERHPHLIYCSISAYGVTSPWAKRPGFDPVLQAESGIMSYTGHPDGPPTRHPLAIIDTFTAMYATSAILAAYIARLRTGKGQLIDLALMDTAVAVQTNAAQSYLVSGQDPVRMGNSHPAAVPVGLFETQTGPFYMAVGTQKLFALLCEKVLERPDLLTDPRFATNSARQANREAVFGLLNDTFAANTREYWLDRMVAAGEGLATLLEICPPRSPPAACSPPSTTRPPARSVCWDPPTTSRTRRPRPRKPRPSSASTPKPSSATSSARTTRCSAAGAPAAPSLDLSESFRPRAEARIVGTRHPQGETTSRGPARSAAARA